MGTVSVLLGIAILLIAGIRLVHFSVSKKVLGIPVLLLTLGILLFTSGCGKNDSQLGTASEKKANQEVAREESEESIKRIENEKGELIEIHIDPDDKVGFEEIPEGWVSKAKSFNPYTDVWLNVYREPLTPEKFKEKFNAWSKVNLGYEELLINEVNIEKGEVNDAFKIDFRDETILIGGVNNDNEIINLTAILEEDSYYDNLEIMKILLRVGIPTVREENLNTIFEDLTYFDGGYINRLGEVYHKEVEQTEVSLTHEISPDEILITIFSIDFPK
ncbi:hypothetical protein [Sporosarcina ureilytica]|uniref:Uncharacterized protein n=1 Tax=Sporosarcina ureilytica TaxID=298596 RepID=A0A1D8JFC6_9BACL|nr:hypothetical protein [Sporosarcina ureilytica]AOV07393.1 hypothetical protein BI350_07465 [Sporosarcina ureilytica]